MKEIFNKKLKVELVLPVSFETKGLMVTLANTFVMHGGTLLMYKENGEEETLFFETNEIVYHLIKRFINDSFDYIEIDNGDGDVKWKVLRLMSVESN